MTSISLIYFSIDLYYSVEQPQPRYIAYHIYRMFFKISKNIATKLVCGILRYFFELLGQSRPTAGEAQTGSSGQNTVLGCSQREK